MRFFQLLLLASLATFSACTEVDRYTQFDMEYTQTVVVPSSSGISLPINLVTPETETNSESKFENNDTRKDLIEEIRLTQMELTLTKPENGDFSFLESIEVFLRADGLDEIRVAWEEDVPENVGKELSLTTTGEDLKAYVKKEEFSLRVKTVTDEALTSDHHIEVYSSFFVDAEVLGQ